MNFPGFVLYNSANNSLFRDGAGTKFFQDEAEALNYRGLARYNPALERSIRGYEPCPAMCNITAIPVVEAT